MSKGLETLASFFTRNNIQKKIARISFLSGLARQRRLAYNIQKKIARWGPGEGLIRERGEALQHSKENSKLVWAYHTFTPYSSVSNNIQKKIASYETGKGVVVDAGDTQYVTHYNIQKKIASPSSSYHHSKMGFIMHNIQKKIARLFFSDRL